MNFEDKYILDLCVKYGGAQMKCLRIESEVKRLAAEGNHKKKNKIIHTQGQTASTARNEALRRLVELLDQEAEKILNHIS